MFLHIGLIKVFSPQLSTVSSRVSWHWSEMNSIWEKLRPTNSFKTCQQIIFHTRDLKLDNQILARDENHMMMRRDSSSWESYGELKFWSKEVLVTCDNVLLDSKLPGALTAIAHAEWRLNRALMRAWPRMESSNSSSLSSFSFASKRRSHEISSIFTGNWGNVWLVARLKISGSVLYPWL